MSKKVEITQGQKLEREVTLRPTAMTPLADAEGRRRSNLGPYLPVLEACTVCPARCCRLSVRVSLPDALRYARVLDVPLFAGIVPVAGTHPEHAFRLDRDPRLVSDDDPWPGFAELQLRRREDGGCHGLIEVGGYARCGVYEARPSTCRTYPVSWSSPPEEGGPGALLCPVPYAVTPEREATFVSEIRRALGTWSLHAEVVAEWNARPDGEASTLEGFLAFALPKVAAATGAPLGDVLACGWPDERLRTAMLESRVLRPGWTLRPSGVFAGLQPRSR